MAPGHLSFHVELERVETETSDGRNLNVPIFKMGNMMVEYVGWRPHRELRYHRRLMSLRHLSFLVELKRVETEISVGRNLNVPIILKWEI